MPTHVTHGGIVSTFPGQGQGGGHGTPPPFAQLPVVGVTADSGRTADSTCWTADGKVICVDVAPALFDDTDAFHAPSIDAAGIPQQTLTAALYSDSDAFHASVLASESTLAASLFDDADLVHASALASEGAEQTVAPALLDDANEFHIPGIVLPGAEQTLAAELHIDTDAIRGSTIGFEIEPPLVLPGGGGFVLPQRPFPVYGVGYGVLPELWGEAHGVVGVAGKSAAQVLVRAAAVGACGQAGHAAVVLKGLSVAGRGAVGARGAGAGVIVKFSGRATGRHDDDEAAVLAFLLAA